MTGGCGGSRAASPAGPSEEGGGAEWRRIYDRVEALLPQVEKLAGDRARLGEITRTQQKQSEARENSLHARLLQAKASRWRWKTAYIELPLLANPKIAELKENDLEDSRKCEALVDIDNPGPQIQLKGARRHADLSETNVGYEDIVRDLRAELTKLKQAYEIEKLMSANKDKEATEAAQKLQQNIGELQVAAQKKDDEIVRLRAEAVDAKNKETSHKRRRDTNEMHIEQPTESSQKRRMDTNVMHLQQRTIKIFVKIRGGRTITLKVKRSDTIYDVKDKIQDKEGIPACQQRLMFGSELLVGSCTLEDHDIWDESTLTLQLVLQGMHIFVKTLPGQVLTFEVDRADTVYNVKAQILDETGILPVQQRIILAGKLLAEEDRTLAEYDIQNNHNLYLVLRIWMHISVRTPTGRTVIDCCALGSDTVGHLKAKIHAELCIPP